MTVKDETPAITAAETVRILVGEWASTIDMPAPNRLDITLNRADDLMAAVAGLLVKRMGTLTAITGLDLGPESGELEVLYHFCTGALIVTLRVRLPRDGAAVPTLSEIIPIAETYERELQEMLGVTVVGLRNKARLYLPDDWPAGVYPLRKDFDPGILSQ